MSLFYLFFFSGVANASDSLKHYKATRIFEPIKIDGQLTESAWTNTISFSDFVMNRPIEGSAPTQKTEVRIVYDNTAIYVGAMLYDTAPDSILKELGQTLPATVVLQTSMQIISDLFSTPTIHGKMLMILECMPQAFKLTVAIVIICLMLFGKVL
ncbi:MAG: hypothetical protein IPJ93_11890 [Bacteroidota bacterium]|nr:MAG: hypothetical protein IPJ93_11890 [Bacteroidota bacterium]